MIPCSLVAVYRRIAEIYRLHFHGRKAKSSLCLTTEALLYEGVWGVDIDIHVFLTSALVGREWSASRPGRFIPGEEPQVPIG
jgi:hypothetical protein